MASRGRVLLVDDDPLAVAALVGILGDEFELQAVATVQAATQAIVRTEFDIVMTDYDLPDGSGADVAQMAARRGHRTFTIVVTDPSDDPRVRALVDDGSLLVLYEPLGPADLLQWLRHGLASVRMRSSASSVPTS
jgi:two-component system, NtrC family, response regulator HydG